MARVRFVDGRSATASQEARPMRRRAFLRAAGAVPALVMLRAAAQAPYPSKPIRLIVPFPPAGAADLTARTIAQPLAQALGQPIVVENKPGADGAIAADVVVKSAPDGYTLFYGTNTAMCGVPAMRKNPPYDPLADFTPISLVGTFGFFLFVNPALPAKSARELIDYARANPGKLNYATGNSTSVLATAQLKLAERLDIVEIPYKGDAPATADLVGGRVQMMIATPGTAAAFVKEGRLRALAALQSSRSALLPDVPTAAEAGLPPLPIQPWAALFGPAKMPKDVVERIARETAAVVARPEVREQLERYAFEGRSSTPEELGAFLKAQVEVWSRTAREIGIVPD
jgi:tripartite-type tricarboxylate transporter receptor subunit TctC